MMWKGIAESVSDHNGLVAELEIRARLRILSFNGCGFDSHQAYSFVLMPLIAYLVNAPVWKIGDRARYPWWHLRIRETVTSDVSSNLFKGELDKHQDSVQPWDSQLFCWRFSYTNENIFRFLVMEVVSVFGSFHINQKVPRIWLCRSYNGNT